MNKRAQMSLIAIGVVCVISAAFGLFYNFSTLTVALSRAFPTDKDSPYFYQAFYTMSSVCILCYLLLFCCGVAFLRRSVRLVWLFVSLMIFEVIYFFSLGFFLWPMPQLGLSIAGATGVANGGLMAQFLILFPLWGSILAIWAKRHLQS